jgi:DNA-binding XRE family transcriptional regulator
LGSAVATSGPPRSGFARTAVGLLSLFVVFFALAFGILVTCSRRDPAREQPVRVTHGWQLRNVSDGTIVTFMTMRIAFRLTAAEHSALLAWAGQTFPDAVPSDHETARGIVLQRLVHDGALTQGGEVRANLQVRKPRPRAISGKRLRAARERAGLTQATACRLFGVARPTWTLWESGTKHVPARLAALVQTWIDSGNVPKAGELENRERRTAWARLLDEKLIGDEED